MPSDRPASTVGFAQAANARDWGRVLSHVSTDYKDKEGMTKDSLRGLAAQASRLERVSVQTKMEGVTISDKNRATVLLRLSVARSEGGAMSLDVMIVLQKTGTWWQQFMGHGWQVTDAEGWQPAAGPTE